VKHGKGNTNSPELSLLKLLPLACIPSQPFLGSQLGFHIIFPTALYGTLYTCFTAAWAVLN